MEYGPRGRGDEWLRVRQSNTPDDDSPGVGFLAGPELLDFYETAIASPTFSVLVSLGLLERATFSILCSFFLWRALRARYNKHRTAIEHVPRVPLLCRPPAPLTHTAQSVCSYVRRGSGSVL